MFLAAVEAASSIWKNAFNSGDAAGCVNQYETHKELWVLQTDGSAKLREDDFEVLDS